MKVAIIINSSWNIYNFRKGLVQSLLERGDEVTAIAPNDKYSDSLIKWGCKFIPLGMDGTGMNPVKDIGLVFLLRKKLIEVKPDVILTYTIKPNLYASVAAGSLGIPCICNVSGLGTAFLTRGLLKQFAIFLYSFCFRFNKWVFFQNNEDRDEFLKLIRVNGSKTSLLPGSGVNIDDFSFSPLTENKKKTTFLMVARLIIEKGVRDYIEAIRLIKNQRSDVEFRLIGSLDETHSRAITKSELNEWVNEGLITYKNHMPDIREDLKTVEIIVLPSYREGTPRTLLEGGAMGRMLLASDVPGCRHVVKSGINGFLFDAKNPKSLAEKINLLMSLSKDERRQMSIAARKSVEDNFDEKIVVKKYLSKIDELVFVKDEHKDQKQRPISN